MWWEDFLTRIVETDEVVEQDGERHELADTAVLRIGARWEDLVQQDLVACLNRDTSAYAAQMNLSLRRHMSRHECQAILFGTRYSDFRSVGDLRAFAKRFLVSKYNVFSHIPKSSETLIDRFFIVRNLVAHYSSFAERAYYGLLRREYGFRRMRAPAEFLLATDLTTGNIRIVDFTQAFLRAEDAMRIATSKF